MKTLINHVLWLLGFDSSDQHSMIQFVYPVEVEQIGVSEIYDPRRSHPAEMRDALGHKIVEHLIEKGFIQFDDSFDMVTNQRMIRAFITAAGRLKKEVRK